MVTHRMNLPDMHTMQAAHNATWFPYPYLGFQSLSRVAEAFRREASLMAMEDADRPSAGGQAADVKCCRRLAASAATSEGAAATAGRSLSAREGSGSD